MEEQNKVNRENLQDALDGCKVKVDVGVKDLGTREYYAVVGLAVVGVYATGKAIEKYGKIGITKGKELLERKRKTGRFGFGSGDEEA